MYRNQHRWQRNRESYAAKGLATSIAPLNGPPNPQGCYRNQQCHADKGLTTVPGRAETQILNRQINKTPTNNWSKTDQYCHSAVSAAERRMMIVLILVLVTSTQACVIGNGMMRCITAKDAIETLQRDAKETAAHRQVMRGL